MVKETAAAMAVSGLVLAGGAGRRMGGSDKGLLAHRGRPLVAGVVERLAAQVDEVMIAAAAPGYLSYGRLVADAWHEADGGRAGPLAGLLGGLRAARHPLVAAVPCDVPGLPLDLVARLRARLGDADVAIASLQGRVQPVFLLVHTSCAPVIERYLAAGGRRADGWHASVRSVVVPFDDEAACFAGANTPEELRALP